MGVEHVGRLERGLTTVTLISVISIKLILHGLFFFSIGIFIVVIGLVRMVKFDNISTRLFRKRRRLMILDVTSNVLNNLVVIMVKVVLAMKVLEVNFDAGLAGESGLAQTALEPLEAIMD